MSIQNDRYCLCLVAMPRTNSHTCRSKMPCHCTNEELHNVTGSEKLSQTRICPKAQGPPNSTLEFSGALKRRTPYYDKILRLHQQFTSPWTAKGNHSPMTISSVPGFRVSSSRHRAGSGYSGGVLTISPHVSADEVYIVGFVGANIDRPYPRS